MLTATCHEDIRGIYAGTQKGAVEHKKDWVIISNNNLHYRVVMLLKPEDNTE